jgi:hypothetical protein
MAKYISPARQALNDALESLNDTLESLDKILVQEIAGSEVFDPVQVNDIYSKVLEVKDDISSTVVETHMK